MCLGRKPWPVLPEHGDDPKPVDVGESADGSRPRHKIALDVVAAERLEDRKLCRGLDAFGSHLQAEIVAEVDDRSRERQRVVAFPRPFSRTTYRF